MMRHAQTEFSLNSETGSGTVAASERGLVASMVLRTAADRYVLLALDSMRRSCMGRV